MTQGYPRFANIHGTANGWFMTVTRSAGRRGLLDDGGS
jgi:hypothetical protein